MLEQKFKTRKRMIRVAVSVTCHIHKTNNNIFLTLTKLNGDVLVQMSGGNIGMKGPRRSTPNAAELVGRKMGSKMVEMGHRRCIMTIRGPFENIAKSVLRGLRVCRIRVMELQQVKGLAHNGVRKRKPRRM